VATTTSDDDDDDDDDGRIKIKKIVVVARRRGEGKNLYLLISFSDPPLSTQKNTYARKCTRGCYFFFLNSSAWVFLARKERERDKPFTRM